LLRFLFDPLPERRDLRSSFGRLSLAVLLQTFRVKTPEDSRLTLVPVGVVP